MAYVKKVEKIEKIDGGEVKVQRLLSDYTLFFDEEGNVISGFKTAEDLYAVITPDFCKQLKMMTKVCHYNNYLHMIEDAREFCSDVYNSSIATGVWVDTLDGPIHGVLLTKEDEEVLWTLTKEGIPQKHLLGIAKYQYGRKLTLNRESKMSHKLWVTTDWLLYR